jgi:two-component system chemotaxis sensor kinase CheA
MHLVRNSIDHGVESAEVRAARGKPARGTLRLNAFHDSGSIVIEVGDDGGGIDPDRVLAKATERGLVEPGVTLSDSELYGLIFEPGFSTKERVSDLSGRGVGMDVVKRNVSALRGTIDVENHPGEGCTMRIRLPLTLAIIDGFLLGVGSSKFILPLDAVAEVIADRPSAGTVDQRGRSCVELRGQLLPVANLRTLYALDSPQPARSSIVVVRAGARRFGVMVDVLLGQHQTVIKPLGPMLRSLRGVSGSSILGSGEVALIFDAAALGQLADGTRHAGARPPSPPRDVARSPLSPLTTEQS